MNAGGRAWARSSMGILAGVCKGLAQRFDLDVLLVRIGWLFAFIVCGVGGLVYLILALSLPREGRLAEAYNSRLLGVCARFSLRFDLDVGLVRAGFLTLFLFSLGSVGLFYLILAFILPSREECLKTKSQS